jgi:hypothetical protein
MGAEIWFSTTQRRPVRHPQIDILKVILMSASHRIAFAATLLLEHHTNTNSSSEQQQSISATERPRHVMHSQQTASLFSLNCVRILLWIPKEMNSQRRKRKADREGKVR